VKKSGAWFTYEGDQLGQGRENSRQFLFEHADMAREIERRIREAVGLTAFGDGEAPVTVVPDVAVSDEPPAPSKSRPKEKEKEREAQPAPAS
jgi:recombination protein RecA